MKVIKLINRGGFGRVELVMLPNGSKCARKTFDPSIPIDSGEELEKMRRRFVREIHIQKYLNSPAFVEILDFDPNGDNPWFLMPLAERNFADEIENIRATGVSPQEALADILNALEELHDLGFVHRDLKPENILYVNGQWRLTDFGLVLPPSGMTTKLTSYASNWGTTSYCAPEQVIEFRNATTAVDIYAFGCILHDIYNGQPRVPYQQQTADGQIGLVIEKCTETQPNRRFRSVRALRGALLTLLSAAPNIAVSATAAEWLESLKSVADWTGEKLESFVGYIRKETEYPNIFTIFSELDEDALNAMHGLDPDLWKTIALEYIEWVKKTTFDFSFCDVLVKRLESIFATEDIEIKAQCVLAAAELGSSHNRWFVMRRVLSMCGPILAENVANRIKIEILAAEAQQNFRRCADVINEAYNNYHPLIATILTDHE